MRLHVLLLCALAALVASACSKKSSKEFHKLAADQESLVLRDGDDAWASPEMDTIVAGLNAVPEDTIEKPRAVALVQKIAAEKARVEAEKAAAAPPPKPPEEAPSFPPSTLGTGSPSEPAPTEAAPEAATDAGVPMPSPTLGMSKAEFQKFFGACFSDGPKMKLSSGADAAATLVLGSSTDCQAKFGPTVANGRTLYLFNDKGLVEKATEVFSTVDAGQVVIPGRQPPTPDPGPPALTIPGAPALPPVGADAG